MNRFSRANTRPFRLHQLLLSTAVIALPAAAYAQTSPVETIIVTATRDNAAAIAPSMAPLDAVQPTSMISQDFIAKNFSGSTNYDEVIKFTPSTFDVAPNGPGLAESQGISIRGFQDGQFNVTFDGIPWQDSNDFTHHSTSYFMAHDLGAITVDRGPGTAATIGDATFGGTVYILSKAPSDEIGFNPYVSYGSFNTLLYGFEFDSGTIDDTGGTRLFIDAEDLHSDGYLTNEYQDRQNIFAKLVQPLDSHTTLAFVVAVNHIHQGISLGATADEIATLGPNWGLTKDPTQQNYVGYNLDHITTDFEYMDLASTFGNGWTLDTKVYTYAYFHRGFNGEDPNADNSDPSSAPFPNQVVLTNGGNCSSGVGSNGCVSGVPGELLQNDYRSVGTITRITKDLPFGDVKFGIWYDQQFNTRSLREVDMSDGFAPNFDPGNGGGAVVIAPGTPGIRIDGGVDRLLTQTLQTMQPYLQADWNVTDALTLSPGVRYSWFQRSVNAPVDLNGDLFNVYTNTYDAVLPSIEAHYTIDPDWTAYGQIAKGFLAPNEKIFSNTAPGQSNFSPENTWNYQIGTSRQLDNFIVSADAYYIDFSNFFETKQFGGISGPISLGGVHYKGLEGELTYMIGGGFSAYASGSLNDAKQTTSNPALLQTPNGWVQGTPEDTWVVGGIYSRGPLYASLLGKYTGARPGDIATATPGFANSGSGSAFFTLDASFGYDLTDLIGGAVKNASIKINVQNLTDVTKIDYNAGSTINGEPIYWTVPGRSVFVTLSTTF
jgi:iron complex outermembrane recepter protein